MYVPGRSRALFSSPPISSAAKLEAFISEKSSALSSISLTCVHQWNCVLSSGNVLFSVCRIYAVVSSAYYMSTTTAGSLTSVSDTDTPPDETHSVHHPTSGDTTAHDTRTPIESSDVEGALMFDKITAAWILRGQPIQIDVDMLCFLWYLPLLHYIIALHPEEHRWGTPSDMVYLSRYLARVWKVKLTIIMLSVRICTKYVNDDSPLEACSIHEALDMLRKDIKAMGLVMHEIDGEYNFCAIGTGCIQSTLCHSATWCMHRDLHFHISGSLYGEVIHAKYRGSQTPSCLPIIEESIMQRMLAAWIMKGTTIRCYENVFVQIIQIPCYVYSYSKECTDPHWGNPKDFTRLASILGGVCDKGIILYHLRLTSAAIFRPNRPPAALTIPNALLRSCSIGHCVSVILHDFSDNCVFWILGGWTPSK